HRYQIYREVARPIEHSSCPCAGKKHHRLVAHNPLTPIGVFQSLEPTGRNNITARILKISRIPHK
ncbi:hypothetical protein, partial [Tamilnaduibacter salinus]|uniref:hypothetical protein n=1 Tax=Tamilnaduibacter salinus TaxID=1484056 RepID=UPI001B808048